MIPGPEVPHRPAEATPAARLEALLALPDEAAREDALRMFVAQHAPEQVREALRGRLADLRGPAGDVLLRLVSAFGASEQYDELLTALLDGPTLPTERAWEALRLLEDAGHLDDAPDLRDELEEVEAALFDEDATLEELAEVIRSDPDGIRLALEGLDAIEPDLRPSIVEGLARRGAGAALIECLRLLSHSHDPAMRAAALEGLAGLVDPDAAVGSGPPALPAGPGRLAVPRPVIRSSLVTTPDAGGRAYVVLTSAAGDEAHTAAFGIDVLRGVAEVVGEPGEAAGEALRAEIAAHPRRDAIEEVPGLALRLLSGALLLSGPGAPVSLRYWLERTVGDDLPARPLREPTDLGEPIEMAAAARDVLDACPWWVDDSPLVRELAAELLLRRGEADPLDAPGVVRFLFEGRLRDRLDLDRSILLWMAAYWAADGREALAASALAIAAQLLDPQFAVPGHPFLAELAARSLRRAAEALDGPA